MKEGEITGRVSATGNKNYARNLFLEVIARLDSRPLKALRDEVYEEFRKNLPVVDNCSAFEGQGLPESNESVELTEALLQWQNEWNLLENPTSDKWVQSWAINTLFRHWDRSPRHIKNRLIIFPIGSELPSITPYAFTPEPFVRNDRMTGTPFVPLNTEQYVDRMCRQLRASLTHYCRENENLLNESELANFQEVSSRDVIWTVGWQISRSSYAELSNHPVKLIKEKGGPQYLNPNDVHRISDIEYKTYHKSTVKRAVTKLLTRIGIIPRDTVAF